MRINVDQGKLHAELSLAQGAIEVKSTTTRPVCGMVKLEASGEYLVLTSTDMILAFKSRIPATVGEPGTALVNAELLHRFVSKCQPGAEIKIETTDNGIAINSGRSRARLLAFGDEELPEPPDRGQPIVSLPVATMHDLMARVVFAIGFDGPQFQLQGAHFELGENSVTAVGTDAKVLSVCSCPLDGTFEPQKAILPFKAVRQLLTLSSKSQSDNVNVYLNDGHWWFGFGTRLLYARAVVGIFPNWKRVTPKDGDVTDVTVVPASGLRDAIERVTMFSDIRSRAVVFTFSNSTITLHALDRDKGECSETIQCECNHELDIKLNSSYVLDALKIADGSSVEIRTRKPLDFCDIRIVNDDSFKVFIAPME